MYKKAGWAFLISMINIEMVYLMGAPDWGLMAVGILTYNIWMAR